MFNPPRLLHVLPSFLIIVSSLIIITQLASPPKTTTPTVAPNEASGEVGWQIYKDSTYGFELKYPATSQPEIEIISSGSDDYYVDRKIEGFKNIGKRILVADVATINPTLKGKIIEYEGIGGMRRYAYIKFPDETIYSIIRISYTNRKSLDQILSTFKFLGQITPTPTPSIPLNWKTYIDNSGKFSFKYPPDFGTEIDNEDVAVSSTPSNCFTDARGSNDPVIASEITIHFNPLKGQNFSQNWKFGANYDSQTLIDGRPAYYFYQGAESVFGTTNYLVDISPTSALKIVVESPELVYRCDKPLNKNRGLATAKLILSTLKFLDQKPQTCTTDASCPQPMCIPGEQVCSATGCSPCIGISCRNGVCQSSTPIRTVKLYYYNINLDPKRDCINEAIAPVERTIPISSTPIRDTLNLLLRGQLTASEISQGFSTEFPHPDFKLLNANLTNGVLTLEFPEVPSFTTGGTCRIGLLGGQIIETALQFPQVKKVIFDPEVFQP